MSRLLHLHYITRIAFAANVAANSTENPDTAPVKKSKS